MGFCFPLFSNQGKFGSNKLFIDAKIGDLAKVLSAIKGVIPLENGATKNQKFKKFGARTNGYMTCLGCLTAMRCVVLRRKRHHTISHITLGMKHAGERSAGNPHAPFDVEGAGNVAMAAELRAGVKALE
jgi:hypothetical protein